MAITRSCLLPAVANIMTRTELQVFSAFCDHARSLGLYNMHAMRCVDVVIDQALRRKYVEEMAALLDEGTDSPLDGISLEFMGIMHDHALSHKQADAILEFIRRTTRPRDEYAASSLFTSSFNRSQTLKKRILTADYPMMQSLDQYTIRVHPFRGQLPLQRQLDYHGMDIFAVVQDLLFDMRNVEDAAGLDFEPRTATNARGERCFTDLATGKWYVPSPLRRHACI